MYVKKYNSPTKEYQTLVSDIKEFGERFPKKHGDWYRALMAGKYVLLDTWNGHIAAFDNDCSPSGKDIYGGVVTFYGKREALCGYSSDYREYDAMEKFRPYLHLVGSY